MAGGLKKFRWLIHPGRAVVAAVALMASLGCGSRAPGGGEELPAATPVPGTIRVETFASAAQIVAGQSVRISCVVSVGREFIQAAQTTVVVSGPVEAIAEADNTFVARPTSVGLYGFRCRAADGAGATVTDPLGVRVQVAAAAATQVDTVIESGADGATPIIPAGEKSTVACILRDQYDNPVDQRPTSDGVTPYLYALTVDSSFEVSPPRNGKFSVRGSRVGQYELACAAKFLGGAEQAFNDASPATLVVVAGAAGSSTTAVSATLVRPTELVSVSCAVSDAYGNPLSASSQVSTTIRVVGAAGGQDLGLVINSDGDGRSHTFSAEVAGAYYVMCRVPGFRAGDETPAQVTVVPGLAHSWEVDLFEQECFWQDRGLPLFIEAYDRWGNRIAPADYSLAVSSVPAGAVLDADGFVLVPGEGDIDLSITYGGPVASGGGVQPFLRTVRVDSTPPTVDFTSPARGHALLNSGSSQRLLGVASDATSSLESLVVDGQVIAVSGSTGVIDVATPARWGLNIFGGAVTDTCGNRRIFNRSFLLSPQYFPAEVVAAPAARAPSSVIMHMGQELLDDGDRDPDDLATIIDGALASIDLNTAVPTNIMASRDYNGDGLQDTHFHDCWWPLRDRTNRYTGWQLGKNGNFTSGGLRITQFTAVDGGARVGLSMANLDMPFLVRGWLDWNCAGNPSAHADVTVSASVISIDVQASISRAGAGTAVTICPTCVNVGLGRLGFEIRTGLGSLVDDLLNDGGTAALNNSRDRLRVTLADAVRGSLPGAIQSFLDQVNVASSFAIPPPLAMTMNISSSLDHIRFAGPQGSGYGELGFAMQVYPGARGARIPEDARGAIREQAGGNLPDFPGARDFGVGLRDDLFNQLLWALWYGGGLSLSRDDVAGLVQLDPSITDFRIEALLPPVIMPGADAGSLELGIGDLYVGATIDLGLLLGGADAPPAPLTIGAYLSTVMPGVMDVDPASNELLLGIAPEADIFVEVVEIDDPGYQAPMTQVLSRLLSVLLPRLLGSAVGAFPLPEVDMSRFGPGYGTLVLDAAEFQRANSNYIILQGNLALLPPRR